MKRILAILILLLLVVTVYAGGINNAKDLVAFALALNNGADVSAWQNDKGVVCLEGDVDMAKVKKWTPIKEFKGTFDGCGYALKNWKTTHGLFELLTDSAEVRNLRVDASCLMMVATREETNAGFVAAISKGRVDNCENCAPIYYRATPTNKSISIGGLVGQNGYLMIDCRNSGAITAECYIAPADNKQAIYIGGVVGRTIPKSRGYYTIVRCENRGKITYKGDLSRASVGGVIGRSYRAGVRLCTNRGDIEAKSDNSGYSYVGGVVANTDQHVQCSDNFGKISIAGTQKTSAGGVCGGVFEAKNIIGCSNYGSVVSSCSLFSSFGGVLGVSKAGAHIVNCYNYASVEFAGSGAEEISYMGGIVGCLVSKKELRCGSYMRLCTNYGKVSSAVESDKMRMGGIGGVIKGSEIAPVKLFDCANEGELIGGGNVVDEIAPKRKYTLVEGEYFHNNLAQAVEDLNGECNLYGRVTSTAGEAIVGAVISDGEWSVQTDANGYYKIKSDLAKARFVTISTPSDCKLSFRKGVPQMFKRIPRHAKAVVANFVLEKREKPLDKYTVIMMGDPQIRGVGVDSAVYRLKNFVYPDIVALKKEKKATDENFFAINLGDLVFNDMTKFDDFLECASGCGFEMFHAIGNHDHDQTTILDTRLGTMHFEEYFQPINYSFNIGKTHYVVVDNISWTRKDTRTPYDIGLDYFECKWLEQDLQFIPKEHTIVICSHAQLFRRPLPVHMKLPYEPDLNSGDKVNFDIYSKILEPYSKVYAWSGHYHYNYGYDYNKTNEAPRFNNIHSICVARCCGGLHVSRYLFNDGTPSGYMVVEVDGDEMKWYYKSEGYDRDYQMNIYDPTRTGGELVKVNIWNWSPDYWTMPEWWENGEKVGYMNHLPEKDIAYLEDYAKQGPFLGSKGDDKAIPHEAHGTFHIKPSEGARSGEVRVTDNFGKTYIEKVEW